MIARYVTRITNAAAVDFLKVKICKDKIIGNKLIARYGMLLVNAKKSLADHSTTIQVADQCKRWLLYLS